MHFVHHCNRVLFLSFEIHFAAILFINYDFAGKHIPNKLRCLLLSAVNQTLLHNRDVLSDSAWQRMLPIDDTDYGIRYPDTMPRRWSGDRTPGHNNKAIQWRLQRPTGNTRHGNRCYAAQFARDGHRILNIICLFHCRKVNYKQSLQWYCLISNIKGNTLDSR